jgi:hypothetical protein
MGQDTGPNPTDPQQPGSNHHVSTDVQGFSLSKGIQVIFGSHVDVSVD